MALLTTSELDSIRDHMRETLSDTCTIEAMTRQSDGMGGWTETWAARGTGIPCRIRPLSRDREANITAEQIQEPMVWSLSLPYDQDIALEDRVIVNGHYYKVLQVNDDETEIVLKRARLVRVG